MRGDLVPSVHPAKPRTPEPGRPGEARRGHGSGRRTSDQHPSTHSSVLPRGPVTAASGPQQGGRRRDPPGPAMFTSPRSLSSESLGFAAHRGLGSVSARSPARPATVVPEPALPQALGGERTHLSTGWRGSRAVFLGWSALVNLGAGGRQVGRDPATVQLDRSVGARET